MTVSEMYAKLTPENQQIVRDKIDELVEAQARKEAKGEDQN